MEISKSIRVTELARIAHLSKPAVTQALRNLPSELLEKSGTRIYGIAPELVQKFLLDRGFTEFYQSALFVIATQTGGAGKTSTTLNIAAAARRLTDRKHAIVLIDADSQASLSIQTTGSPASANEPVLNHLIENKCDLQTALVDIGENTWIIKSSLNNLYNDRALGDAKRIRFKMLEIVKAIYKRFGKGTKIFVDTPPQLSAVSQSLVCAIGDLERAYLLVPIRQDLFGVAGAKICIREAVETLKTFNLDPSRLRASCFLSAHNAKSNASIKALTEILEDEFLRPYLSPIAVRHSAELPKSTYRQGAVFNDTRHIKTIGTDYSDLLLTTVGWESPAE